MIKYALQCRHKHAFEAWFSNATAFEAQVEAGQVECPICGDTTITKQIMAPAVRTKSSGKSPVSPGSDMAAKMADLAGKMQAHIRDNYDYVGDRFASVARDMHDGKTEEKLVWGETTPEEAKSLIDDGVKAAPIPPGIAPKPPKALN